MEKLFIALAGAFPAWVILGAGVPSAGRLRIELALVGAVPAGTASNVICFIARINVALSVTLTACSTLLGVLMTPLLATWRTEALALDEQESPG